MTVIPPSFAEDDFDKYYEDIDGAYIISGHSKDLLLQIAEIMDAIEDNLDRFYELWEEFDERFKNTGLRPLSSGVASFIIPIGKNSIIHSEYPPVRNEDVQEAIKTLLFDRAPRFFTHIRPSASETRYESSNAPEAESASEENGAGKWETYAEIAREYHWVFEHFPPASSLDSPIRRLGYIVGKRGLERPIRHEFLETFYNLSLPAEESEAVRIEWGAPGSDKRKQRMYDHLTGLAAFREMMDPRKYKMAIDHWREDADFVWAL